MGTPFIWLINDVVLIGYAEVDQHEDEKQCNDNNIDHKSREVGNNKISKGVKMAKVEILLRFT